ncbi:Glycerol uptake facilitator protein [Pseudomonas amygdali pv. sesami]|nr:Glycerol uptake facilitator protein [Pseudomonas amygdali pv. sesami]
MTIALKQPTLTGQCVAEFLGTALMIFFGTGCVAALKVAGATFGLWEICIIWGMAVSMGIYLSAGISGAHLNPAVSIALSLFAGFEKRKLPFYISAQIAGAFCGAGLVYLLYISLFSTSNMRTTSFAAANRALNWRRCSRPIQTLPFPWGRHFWSKWSSPPF